MTILTVYFCGTGSTRFDQSNKNYWNGELISTLAANNEGREFAEWVIMDGPGSGNLQDDELWTKSGEYFGWQGSLAGSGWQENVKHAMNIMKGEVGWQREKLTSMQYENLKKAGVPIQDVEVTGSFLWRHYDYGDRKVTQQQLQQQIIKTWRKGQLLPTQVNLVGWSRGGISCHMLANAMLKDPLLSTIPVNIFAVDPVPGSLNFQTEKTTLGSNVQEYVAFYAKHERTRGFTCVIPKTARTTKVHIFPLAGRHATLVGNAAKDGESAEAAFYGPGKIVRHFAEVCLTRWGVNLSKKLNLDNATLVQLHKEIDESSELYAQMQEKVYTPPGLAVSDNGERYVSLGDSGMALSAVKGAIYTPQAGLAANFQDDSTLYDVLK